MEMETSSPSYKVGRTPPSIFPSKETQSREISSSRPFCVRRPVRALSFGDLAFET